MERLDYVWRLHSLFLVYWLRTANSIDKYRNDEDSEENGNYGENDNDREA